jgi:hypothetical protein
MILHSVTMGAASSDNPKYKTCLARIDDVDATGAVISVSYEKDLANPEIWLVVASENYALKITVNGRIAARGQAWKLPKPSAEGKPEFLTCANPDFDRLMEPMFASSDRKKYFTLDGDNHWLLFEKLIEKVPPINVMDLHDD